MTNTPEGPLQFKNDDNCLLVSQKFTKILPVISVESCITYSVQVMINSMRRSAKAGLFLDFLFCYMNEMALKKFMLFVEVPLGTMQHVVNFHL